jgi:diguanylate cyclase (GGDEF)-like protein/putative nucleotidyltransferase with HDIG domain
MGPEIILLSSWLVPLTIAVTALAMLGVRAFEQRALRRRSEQDLVRFSNLQLLSARLTDAQDPRHMVEVALRGTAHALALTDGLAIVRHPGAKETECSAACGFSNRLFSRLNEEPLRGYLLSAADRWGNLMVFQDLRAPGLAVAWQRDPVFLEFRNVFRSERVKTLVVVGLRTRERSYGVMVLASREVRHFRPGELRLMLAIGNQIVAALERRQLERAADRHTEELRILHRVGEALRSTFDLGRQMEILRGELQSLLGLAEAQLVTREENEGSLVAVETLPASRGLLGENSSVADADLCAHVLRTREPLLIARDLTNAAQMLGIASVDPKLRTWCGVPVEFSDGASAVLAVADREHEHAVDERRFQLLQVLAGEVAVAVSNARLFQREQRRARHLALLNELGRKLTAVLNPKELLDGLCGRMKEAFGYDLISVLVADRESGELVVEAQEGLGTAMLGRRVRPGEGFVGIAAQTGRPIVENEVGGDQRYLTLYPGARSSLNLPLSYREQRLGALSVESVRPRAFSEQDVLSLSTLAEQLAIAMNTAHVYQAAQEQAITDSLTGLKTHRFFMEALESEWRRSPRSRRPFSLIMMDLDGFKQVNDRYGHLEGDRVLVTVARALEARSRQFNVVARYGGDEFAVLMPEGSLEQAEVLAERLRASLATEAILARYGVTGSFGIATFPVHGATPEEILRIAESGIYLAKHEKGNRVRVASATETASDWEQQLLQAYLGVAVKRMFSTGPDAFNQYLDRLERATRDSGQSPSLMDTVTALAFAIDAKDHYTQGHSQAVSQLASQIGQQLGLATEEVEEIRLAGILHDIGKIGVPESVLNKPARLTDEEFEIVKNHAVLGDKILEPLRVKAIERIRRMVRHHHERFDGGGYPDGLSGQNIPLGARILTIADCFDTMVSERSYKKAWTLEEAAQELSRCRGAHFDATLVDSFLQVLATQGDPRNRVTGPAAIN